MIVSAKSAAMARNSCSKPHLRSIVRWAHFHRLITHMSIPQITQVVEGTADPAFAIDSVGLISVWNCAAGELFGFTATEAIGRPCYEILKGTDEGGVTCSDHCYIQQALASKKIVRNFDLRIETKEGRRWSNISILMVTDSRTQSRHAIHVIHPREIRKRLELLVRDFLVTETDLSPEMAARLLASTRLQTSTDATLTAREIEILRFLAQGLTTKGIADQLSISIKTVSNHIGKILAKLGVHTRLEAVRRGQQARLF